MSDPKGPASAAGPGWPGWRNFVVERKVAESDIITSFYLVAEDGGPLPGFRPGQFLTLELDIPGRPEPVVRTYTLSDSPGDKGYYRLTIKREPPPAKEPGLPPGLASNFFHDGVEPGSVIRARAPSGEFYLHPGRRPVVLMSGGVGITPMLSMLNTLIEGDDPRPVYFIHATLNGRVHAMAEPVRALAADHDRLKAYFCYEAPAAGDVLGETFHRQGYIDLDWLKGLLPGRDCDFYLCGPPPFMKAMYDGLRAWEAPAGRIRYEFFGPATVVMEEAPPKSAAKTFEITFARSKTTLEWDGSAKNLLDFAEAGGVTIESSCRSGICGTCETPIIAGDVCYPTSTDKEPQPGHALLCSCVPDGDMIIDA